MIIIIHTYWTLIKSGKSDLNIVEEQIRATSPIWPEVGQRIVLLKMKELKKVETPSRNSQIVFTSLLNMTILLLTIFVILCLPDQELAARG